MHDISLLVLACVQLLNLKTPVQIEYRTKCRGQLKEVAAYCWDSRKKGKLHKFKLIINCRAMVESQYDSTTIIAHEFVHAKMIENGTFNPLNHHCEIFQEIARELSKCLKKAGFSISKRDIYNPDIDDAG